MGVEMKKNIRLLAATFLMAAVLFFPVSAMAIEPPATYDFGNQTSMMIAAYACNGADCDYLDAEDWSNYSNYSANPELSGGAGLTVNAVPGDTITFFGMTGFSGESTILPVYGISFTNIEYLDNFDVFGTGRDDIDADGNYFIYTADDNITLNDPLGGTTQTGSIAATVKADTPDQTVITGTFYVVDPGDERLADWFGTKAYAAGEDAYIMSTVRIVVNNPTATPTPTPTATTTSTPEVLPQTGAPVDSNGTKSIVLEIVMVGSALLLTIDLIRRKVKKA